MVISKCNNWNVEYRDGVKSKIGMPSTHSTVI